jgi:uridine phosphorylase
VTESSTAPADRPRDERGAQYHIRLAPGDLPPRVLLPGDPGRVDVIAAQWDSYEELASYREFRSARGVHRGAAVGAVSTGVGMGGTEIVLQELAAIGVHTVIRVGTTGSIRAELECGDLVVPPAAVRRDGVSHVYAPPEYPAYADPSVRGALLDACRSRGFRHVDGLVCSTSSFYVGQGRPSAGGFLPREAEQVVADLQALGVTNFDMETAGVFVVARVLGLRAAAVSSVIANRVTNTWDDAGGVERACLVASDALAALALAAA